MFIWSKDTSFWAKKVYLCHSFTKYIYVLSTLHLFNPSHDEALALHSSHYMPPFSVRRLAQLLARLPEWWQEEGDMILSLPLSGKAWDAQPPRWERISRIEPWGWDAQIVDFLRKLGAPEELLPSEGQLDRLRQLSSRRTTVRLLEWWGTQVPLPGVLQAESLWCESIEEVDAAVAHFEHRAMLKLPWSSSGRGVFSTRLGYDQPCRQRAERGLRRYGGIEVQGLLMEGEDGALEWEVCEGGEVVFLGCSLFRTTVGGAYLGHHVDRPAQLEACFKARWAARCGAAATESFAALVARLRRAIELLIAPHYTGPLGVDVLFSPEGLHPCIEVNLRRTMGHVALSIADRLPDTELPAQFYVDQEGLQLRPSSAT